MLNSSPHSFSSSFSPSSFLSSLFLLAPPLSPLISFCSPLLLHDLSPQFSWREEKLRRPNYRTKSRAARPLQPPGETQPAPISSGLEEVKKTVSLISFTTWMPLYWSSFSFPPACLLPLLLLLLLLRSYPSYHEILSAANTSAAASAAAAAAAHLSSPPSSPPPLTDVPIEQGDDVGGREICADDPHGVSGLHGCYFAQGLPLLMVTSLGMNVAAGCHDEIG